MQNDEIQQFTFVPTFCILVKTEVVRKPLVNSVLLDTINGSSSNLVLKKSLFLLNNPGSLNVYNYIIINNIYLKMLAI